jgi:hypothetical protein
LQEVHPAVEIRPVVVIDKEVHAVEYGLVGIVAYTLYFIMLACACTPARSNMAIVTMVCWPQVQLHP